MLSSSDGKRNGAVVESKNTHNANNNNIRIEPLHSKHFKEVVPIVKEFFNSKHCCCCIPLGVDEGIAKYEKLQRKYPEKFAVAAVAVRVEDDTVVGFAQMLFENQPSYIHKCKPNEAYLEQLCVSSDARGMGVGTKLLKWCDDLAIERNCDFIGLEVIYNNPAIRLYQRKGYTIQPKNNTSYLEKFCVTTFFCCLLGPMICPAHSSSYCSWGLDHYMKKDLK